jgi:hypothetical protein
MSGPSRILAHVELRTRASQSRESRTKVVAPLPDTPAVDRARAAFRPRRDSGWRAAADLRVRPLQRRLVELGLSKQALQLLVLLLERS